MRNNQPVIQEEYHYPDHITLMSTTDIHGNIIYGNDSFFEVSGFSPEELQGQPHNTVRHPDMPKAAFADMWATLKNGEPWTGIVKNRRKDGRYYWVRASVNPVVRNGQMVGFISVRIKPTREEVASAAALYEQINQGKLKKFKMHKGVLVRQGMGAIFSSGKILPLRWRIRLPILALFILSLGTAAFAGVKGIGLLEYGAVSALLFGLTNFWIEKQIVRPVEHLTKQAINIATGASLSVDNQQRVDELGLTLRAVGQLGLMFRWLIDDVSSQVFTVQSASQALAAGNQQLSQLTDQTATNIQQTASAMNQMTAAIQLNSENASEADRLSLSTSDAASKGGKVVEAVIDTMDQIAASSQKITTIISVIDSIAFQTNILALNAAVEAARAGEGGKGFAVVASEVRNLAQHSAKSAAEIKLLVEASTHNIEFGINQVHDAGSTMNDIVSQVNQVTTLIGKISQATGEQGQGLSEVSLAVAELKEIIQKNAAQVHQSADTSESMKEQASRLALALNVFRHRP